MERHVSGSAEENKEGVALGSVKPRGTILGKERTGCAWRVTMR